jgi:hypothetical protein
MLSPIFPLFLIIFAGILSLSINSVILCDGQTLEDLNRILLEDTTKFDKAMEEYKYYDDAR